MFPQPRRRWALFPGSVLSDHDNPPAVLYRAMAVRLREIGDEARFYEERGNPWLRNLLTQRGAAEIVEFQRNFPAVDYVTFDPRAGQELADWLTRVLGTVDIVLVDAVAPRDIVRWIGELTRPNLHTFLIDPGQRESVLVESIPGVHLFSGVYVRDASESGLSRDRHREQPFVEFGPIETSHQNGDARQHIQRIAEQLISSITGIVDSVRSDGNANQTGQIDLRG